MTARRILIVSDEMEVGGSQRQIVHLLHGLDREQWEPTLLFFRNESFLVNQLRSEGIRCVHLPKSGRLSPRFVLRLFRFLRQERFELIHAYSLTAEIWICALLPLLPTTRFVASIRGLCLVYPRWQWWLKRWVLARADAVISNSLAGARVTAAKTRLDENRIDVIRNGIDIPEPLAASHRRSARHLQGISETRATGLFVGRLVVEKNLPLLLEAMLRIPAVQRPQLLLAGDGPLASLLDDRIEKMGLAKDMVRLGERTDTRWLMQFCDFLVLPSREEGLSNVILEAMAAQLAVLASNVGGNPELIVDGRTGLLFRSDDANDLALTLQKMSQDAQLRARLTAAALDVAQRDCSLPALVAATQAVYVRVLDQGSRHNRYAA